MSEPTNSSTTTANGGPKRYKKQQPPLTVPAGCTCFRLLCHASRIGGVIGKSGVIIKQLQQETSAKIRVEDPLPGSDDRVITVIANSLVNRTISFVGDNNQDEGSEYCEVSAAQEALVRVFERILLVAAETDGGYFAPGGVVSGRILTPKSVIGAVIGKGGKVIEKIRKDTGCKIRIIPQDKLPSCAMPTDEMVELEGDVSAIKRALVTVTRCLQDSPFANKTKLVIGAPNHTTPRENIQNEHINHTPPQTQVFHPTPTTLNGDDVESRTTQHELTLRMLCPADKVGSIIGKSGTVIQAIKNESGASVIIGATIPDCDDRLITITAMESPETRDSPAQNAMILIFNKSVEASFSKGYDPPLASTTVSARLLITQSQMGCLLGKGGAIISDMRKVTGAFIKIVGDHQVPKCALETDQVVLMTGEFVNVRDAIYSVTGRLRNNLFRGVYSRGEYSSHFSHPYTNLTQSMDNLKLSNSMDHVPTSAHWQSQMGHDIGTGSNSVKNGNELVSGGRSAIVTNMSVEIIVPPNVIGSVYGENGSNLTRLRQISGAKVAVHEPHSGTTDYIVVISGTPDETQSAQSLLQAFILADQT